MIDEKIYQSIYDELNKYLAPNWEKLIVYLEYGNASYSFSFYIKSIGEYVKCYDISGISDEALDESFKKIDRLVSKERSKETELWTNMTMVVDKLGNMHTDLDYTDLSEGSYQFKKNWKKKYLN